jgi:hypothetical protein
LCSASRGVLPWVTGARSRIENLVITDRELSSN